MPPLKGQRSTDPIACELRDDVLRYMCPHCGEHHERWAYGLDHTVPRLHLPSCASAPPMIVSPFAVSWVWLVASALTRDVQP